MSLLQSYSDHHSENIFIYKKTKRNCTDRYAAIKRFNSNRQYYELM